MDEFLALMLFTFGVIALLFIAVIPSTDRNRKQIHVIAVAEEQYMVNTDRGVMLFDSTNPFLIRDLKAGKDYKVKLDNDHYSRERILEATPIEVEK